jgi:hypothetical protein
VTARQPRIFIGICEIADYYRQLRAGFEQLGYDAVFVNLFPHPFHETPKDMPRTAKLAAAAARRHAQSDGPVKPLWRFVALLLRLPVFLWAVTTRDLFIFGFGLSFFGHLELPLLRLLRKRIVFIFHGSDSRPAYLNGVEAPTAGCETVDKVIELTRRKKRRVRTVDRWADVVVDNPLSAHLHERPCVSFQAIGVPRATLPATDRAAQRPIRAFHSPSNPGPKGSQEIRDAVDRLRSRGFSLELIELRGVPHERVIEALADVDFAIDQVYSDVAMAGFASEAAAAGVPVVVGGYGRDAIDDALRGRPFPPVLFCRPDDLESSLERLTTDRELRRELGTAARRFVETEWSPPAVAKRLLEAIEGRRPDWVFDPRHITYLHGTGLSEARARSLVRSTIERGGVSALCVRDKPTLEAQLVKFAGLEPDQRGEDSLS